MGGFARPVPECGAKAVHGEGFAHPAQAHGHGHIAQGLTRPSSWENEGLTLGERTRFNQDGHAFVGQRYPMLNLGFHPFGRDRPDALGLIDLGPLGIQHFTGPRCGQHQEQ